MQGSAGKRKELQGVLKRFYTALSIKGYSAVNKGWFIGYKLHIVIFDKRVVRQRALTKGNIHNINILKSMTILFADK